MLWSSAIGSIYLIPRGSPSGGPRGHRGDWRSWLARIVDIDEVTGSSPVSPTFQRPRPDAGGFSFTLSQAPRRAPQAPTCREGRYHPVDAAPATGVRGRETACRRSSMAERVICNLEVGSSTLPGGFQCAPGGRDLPAAAPFRRRNLGEWNGEGRGDIFCSPSPVPRRRWIRTRACTKVAKWARL